MQDGVSEYFDYFTFWIAQNGHLYISTLINFYTFESLRVWVWDPKPIYRLQNSFGCSTEMIKLQLSWMSHYMQKSMQYFNSFRDGNLFFQCTLGMPRHVWPHTQQKLNNQTAASINIQLHAKYELHTTQSIWDIKA